jgi:hypothetical protein
MAIQGFIEKDWLGYSLIRKLLVVIKASLKTYN